MFILSTKVPKRNTVWASKYVIVQLSSNSLDYSAYHIGLSKVLSLLNVSLRLRTDNSPPDSCRYFQ